MAKEVSWITHRGKKLLFVNLAGLKGAEQLGVLDDVEKVYRTLAKQSTLLLVDVTGSVSTVETTQIEKKLAAYGVTRYASVVGVTGFKASIARDVRKDFHLASSVEEAKDWLVSQGE